MEKNFIKKNKNQLMKIAIISIIILILYRIITNITTTMIIVKNFFSVMKPFVFAAMLAYLLYFPCNYLEKRTFKRKKSSKLARITSIAIVYIVFISFLVFLLSYLIPVIINNSIEMVKNIPEYIESIKGLINSIPDESFFATFKSDKIFDALDLVTIENIQSEVTNYFNIERVLGYTEHAVTFVKSIVKFILTFAVSIYMLFDREAITAYFKKFLKARTKKNTYSKIIKSTREANEIFRKYVVSRFADAFVVGVIMTIALLVLKVKFAIFLGFLIGLFNLIPFFGALTAGIVATILTIITGGPDVALKTGIAILVLQQIDANIIEPKIVGTSLDINRIVVIASTTLGGAYFGVWGMFFGVPVVATIKAMIDNHTNKKIKDNKMIRLLNKRILVKLKKPDSNTITRLRIRNKIYT